MDADIERFHKSIAFEIKALQDRVRDLIGDANWAYEGRYKEDLLKGIIKRFLPSTVSLGTGFILQKLQGNLSISKQIDIIVYDNTYPLLFTEGDFIVTTPANVVGIIEVKTNIHHHIKETITNATSNGRFLKKGIFNGIFVFNEYGGLFPNRTIRRSLEDSNGIVNHLCIGQGIFIKHWTHWTTEAINHVDKYSIYGLANLAFTYFISNLVDSISKEDLQERYWFHYPIETGKESWLIEDVHLLR